MSSLQSADNTIEGILWESLGGGNYDLETMKQQFTTESRFDEAGVDSLDLVDFFLRVQDHFNVMMREEDYARLATIKDVENYIAEKGGGDK